MGDGGGKPVDQSMKNLQPGGKPKDALNFLASKGMLKKSWKIPVLVKNFLTQWETKKENQGISQWKTS